MATGQGFCDIGRNVAIDGSRLYQTCVDNGNGQGMMITRQCAPGSMFQVRSGTCGFHL